MLLRNIIGNLLTKNGPINGTRNISIFPTLCREFRKNKRQNIVIREDKVPQEKSFNVEPAWIKQCEFPDENTNDRLFNGVRFADLPIVHIRVSKNNTLFMLVDAKGKALGHRSCGMEGFKNAKKGTNIAAQATAVSFTSKIKRKGFQEVRIAIKGLGPGRMGNWPGGFSYVTCGQTGDIRCTNASIKGLEMGGLNIVSITDVTPTVFGGCSRPRKQRRL